MIGGKCTYRMSDKWNSAWVKLESWVKHGVKLFEVWVKLESWVKLGGQMHISDERQVQFLQWDKEKFTHEILAHCWRNNKRCWRNGNNCSKLRWSWNLWSKWNLNQVEIREGIKRKKTTRRISFLSRSFVMLYVNYIFLWMMEGFVWMILLLSTMINFTKVKFITCLWLKWSSMLISCKGYQLNF